MAVKSEKRYPLDFDLLEKGDRISTKELERILGIGKTHPLFNLRCVKLCKRIEREMMLRDGLVTVRVDRGEVVVCDDSDAAMYNRKRFRSHFKGMVKRHIHNMSVDVSRLDVEERDKHERTILVEAGMLQAAREKRIQLRLSTPQRKTPGLLPPKEDEK